MAWFNFNAVLYFIAISAIKNVVLHYLDWGLCILAWCCGLLAQPNIYDANDCEWRKFA